MKEQWQVLCNKAKSFFGKAALVNPLLEPHFTVLENRLRGAIHFLKSNFISSYAHKKDLNRLPWFLIIGSPACGKTSLLTNSQIKFVLDKKIKYDDVNSIPPSETCDWWITTNTVLIDVPGKYIFHKAKKISLANKLWEHFLYLLKTLRGPEGISGVLIVLSLNELVDKKNHYSIIENLKSRMLELQDRFGKSLPFYFAISKCDLIPGFVEFFNECSKEELLQPWGIHLYNHNDINEIMTVFNSRFDVLIKRINDQLISRLYQERNMHTKCYIKDFPLQLERLKECFSEILRKLAEDIFHLNLKGMYLTSSMQHEQARHFSEQHEIVLANQLQQALAIMELPEEPPQPYFIKHFLLNCLLPRSSAKNPLFWKYNLKTCTAAAFIIISITLYASHFFFTPKVTKNYVLAKQNNTPQFTHMEADVLQESILELLSGNFSFIRRG